MDRVRRNRWPSDPGHVEFLGQPFYEKGQKCVLTDLSDDLLLLIAELIMDPPNIIHDSNLILAPTNTPHPPNSVIGRLHLSESLLCFAMCSRRLYRLTEPVLYQHVRQSDYPNVTQNMLQVFVRTLLSQPDLAPYVRILSVRTPTEHNRPDEPKIKLDMSMLDGGDWARINETVQKSAISSKMAFEWIDSIKDGSWEALLALILVSLPNLHTLNIRHWDDHGTLYTTLTQVLLQAVQLQLTNDASSAALPQLRTVALERGREGGSMNFGKAMPFLRLPSMESFSGANIVEGWTLPPSLAWVDAVYPLPTRQLFLYDALVPVSYLHKFLRCFTSLETLYYDNSSALFETFEPQKLLEGAQAVKHSLQHLTILNSFSLLPRAIEDWNPVWSLADFEVLRSLTMTASIWARQPESDIPITESGSFQRLVDILPPSLEELIIHECTPVVVQPILELVAEKWIHFPLLCKLDIQWTNRTYPCIPAAQGGFVHPGFTDEEASQLLEGCTAADIQVIVRTE